MRDLDHLIMPENIISSLGIPYYHYVLFDSHC